MHTDYMVVKRVIPESYREAILLLETHVVSPSFGFIEFEHIRVPTESTQ
jgi:hypothetical protein